MSAESSSQAWASSRPSATICERFGKICNNGVSGVDRITHFDASAYDCQIAGEVRDFEPAQYFKTPKDVRRTDRYTHLAMAAAKKAIGDAGAIRERSAIRRALA